MVKKTTYKLLPAQWEFLFGSILDKLKSGQEEFLDVSCYQGGFTCLPADAEYLSPTGWKRMDELTKEDKLAVYYDNGTIKYEHPKEVFKFPADKWYEFKTRFTHQVLCPNHKIVYFTDEAGLKPKKISCEEFVQKGCNAHYKIRNFFEPAEGFELDVDDYTLRLFVAIQADGYDYQKIHNNKHSDITVGFHLKKQQKIGRLRKLLTCAGVNFTESVRVNGIKAGCSDFRVKFKHEVVKHFPKEWYNLSARQLGVIADEVKYWDCSLKGGTYAYSTNNKDDRDFIQFAWASQGYCTTCYERTRDISITQQGKTYDYVNKTEYVVNCTKQKLISMGKAVIKEAKGGESKFCPSTSTGMWLARYKNYIFVTGNS